MGENPYIDKRLFIGIAPDIKVDEGAEEVLVAVGELAVALEE
jgi:hypothetical protein